MGRPLVGDTGPRTRSGACAAVVAERWRASGLQWLTAPGVEVPTRLVEGVGSLVSRLDRAGAGIAERSSADGLGLLAERAAVLGLGPAGRTSAGGATRLVQASDGWVAVALARPDDLASVPAWLELGSASIDLDDTDVVWATVTSVLAGGPTARWVERAALLGLACSAVGETTDIRPVVRQRLDGPTRSSGAEVGGLVVVNLASLWAGPLAADLLARCGARVVTVESATRPDGARATPAFHELLHTQDESITLPLAEPSGRRELEGLLRSADVVIEGSRPRALAQMGIDARRLVVDGGPRVWLSITGHGRRAPAGDRIGFGDDAAAAGGLVGREVGATGAARPPVFVGDAIADPLTGLVAADEVVQLVHAGGRWCVDVALARAAAHVARRPGDPRIDPVGVPARPVAPRAGA